MLLLLMGLREMYPVCPLCSMPVELATAGTDEDGKYVHDECYSKPVRTPHPGNPSLRRSIKNFLAAKSSKAPAIVRCKSCNTIMDHLLATFTFGDGESWDIPFPVCMTCERDRNPKLF